MMGTILTSMDVPQIVRQYKLVSQIWRVKSIAIGTVVHFFIINLNMLIYLKVKICYLILHGAMITIQGQEMAVLTAKLTKIILAFNSIILINSLAWEVNSHNMLIIESHFAQIVFLILIIILFLANNALNPLSLFVEITL